MSSALASMTPIYAGMAETFTAFSPVVLVLCGLAVMSAIAFFFLGLVKNRSSAGGSAGGSSGGARGAGVGGVASAGSHPSFSAMSAVHGGGFGGGIRTMMHAASVGRYGVGSRAMGTQVVDAGLEGLKEAKASGSLAKSYDYGTFESPDVRDVEGG